LSRSLINFFLCRKNRCSLKYIPKHLHQNNKPLIPEFHNSERLFWRLGKNPTKSPYSTISLYNVSINRSGTERKFISAEQDVLWNSELNAEQEKYASEVVTLIVRRIFSDNPPIKPIFHPDDITQLNPRHVIMALVHNPLACNYAHCMFVFDLDDVRVTKENYNETFNLRPLKRLRQACRDELNKAILKKEIEI
jgi:hypothetical protein